jgi:hypothetical protein
MVCQVWPFLVSLDLNNMLRVGFTLVMHEKYTAPRTGGLHVNVKWAMAGTGFHSLVTISAQMCTTKKIIYHGLP